MKPMTEEQLREQLLALPAEARHRLGLEAVESAEAEADDGLTEGVRSKLNELALRRYQALKDGRDKGLSMDEFFSALRRPRSEQR